MWSPVDHLLQHLKEVRDRERNGRRRVVRVDGSRAVEGVVEGGVVNQTSRLHLQKRVRAWTQRCQEKEVLEYALVASSLPWLW